MLFFQNIPPSPSPRVQKSVLYICNPICKTEKEPPILFYKTEFTLSLLNLLTLAFTYRLPLYCATKFMVEGKVFGVVLDSRMDHGPSHGPGVVG